MNQTLDVLLSEGYSAQRKTSPSAAPPTAHATWKPGFALSRTIEGRSIDRVVESISQITPAANHRLLDEHALQRLSQILLLRGLKRQIN